MEKKTKLITNDLLLRSNADIQTNINLLQGIKKLIIKFSVDAEIIENEKKKNKF